VKKFAPATQTPDNLRHDEPDSRQTHAWHPWEGLRSGASEGRRSLFQACFGWHRRKLIAVCRFSRSLCCNKQLSSAITACNAKCDATLYRHGRKELASASGDIHTSILSPDTPRDGELAGKDEHWYSGFRRKVQFWFENRGASHDIVGRHTCSGRGRERMTATTIQLGVRPCERFYIIIVEKCPLEYLNNLNKIVDKFSGAWWHRFDNTWIADTPLKISEIRDRVAAALEDVDDAAVLVLRLPEKSTMRGWAFHGSASTNRTTWMREVYKRD